MEYLPVINDKTFSLWKDSAKTDKGYNFFFQAWIKLGIFCQASHNVYVYVYCLLLLNGNKETTKSLALAFPTLSTLNWSNGVQLSKTTSIQQVLLFKS